MDHHEHGGKGQDTRVSEQLTHRPSRQAVCQRPLPNPPPHIGEDAPDIDSGPQIEASVQGTLLDTD